MARCSAHSASHFAFGAAMQGAFLRWLRAVTCAVLLMACTLGMAELALAASATVAPHSGLEGGQGRSYGPDVEKRSGNNLPQTSMPMDAYGNPITGELQDAAPKQRPSAGAYGGYGKQPKAPSRPLPDVPSAPKWGFN